MTDRRSRARRMMFLCANTTRITEFESWGLLGFRKTKQKTKCRWNVRWKRTRTREARWHQSQGRVTIWQWQERKAAAVVTITSLLSTVFLLVFIFLMRLFVGWLVGWFVQASKQSCLFGFFLTFLSSLLFLSWTLFSFIQWRERKKWSDGEEASDRRDKKDTPGRFLHWTISSSANREQDVAANAFVSSTHCLGEIYNSNIYSCCTGLECQAREIQIFWICKRQHLSKTRIDTVVN